MAKTDDTGVEAFAFVSLGFEIDKVDDEDVEERRPVEEDEEKEEVEETRFWVISTNGVPPLLDRFSIIVGFSIAGDPFS